MSKRLYKSESMFELALRLTKAVKESEHFLMREQRNGDVYLESITLLNLIHETLDKPEESTYKGKYQNAQNRSTLTGSTVGYKETLNRAMCANHSASDPAHVCPPVEHKDYCNYVQHGYDHYTFNGQSYQVDWTNLDDDYREFGR